MSKTIGLIAEDKSDIDVIHEILKKYLKFGSFRVKKFVGNGCGKLRNKCDSWTTNLFDSGCDFVFIFHDLDRYDEKVLRKTLEGKICHVNSSNSLVVIPVEELEGWLLSDSDALKKVFGLKAMPTKIYDCETISSPKEYLRDLIYKMEKKRYLNTVHNKKIAESITLENLRRCKSFKPFDEFLNDRVCA